MATDASGSVSGLCLVVRPEHLADVEADLGGLDWIEVYARDEATGRLIVAGGGLMVLMVDAFVKTLKKDHLSYLSLIVLMGAVIAQLVTPADGEVLLGGMLVAGCGSGNAEVTTDETSEAVPAASSPDARAAAPMRSRSTGSMIGEGASSSTF